MSKVIELIQALDAEDIPYVWDIRFGDISPEQEVRVREIAAGLELHVNDPATEATNE